MSGFFLHIDFNSLIFFGKNPNEDTSTNIFNNNNNNNDNKYLKWLAQKITKTLVDFFHWGPLEYHLCTFYLLFA